jgi:hypothetical protein
MYLAFEVKNKPLDIRDLGGKKTVILEKLTCLVELEIGPIEWKEL